MKIDRTKLKKCSSEVPPDCKALIDKLKSCSHDELLEELSKVETWNCGKSDLHHWVDVLDIFDHILEISCEKTKENQWCLPCDEPHWVNQKKLLLAVLQFTVLLIEHSFSRNCYNSMEHLTTLLSSSDMNVVLAVLNLLYAFSKRLNFIARLNTEKRQSLLLRLLYLAESWGGKLNGFGLAECCEDLDITAYPSSASTLHFEYYAENVDDKSHKKTSNTVIAIHIDNVDKISDKSPSRIMEEIIEKYAVPEDKQMQLFTHIRLAHSFSDYPKRILCVQARLQAISILVYSNGMPDNVNSFLYNGLIEELVDVLELQDDNLIELKAAALRTLTSIIHLDKNPKISAIIDTTGAASYHGLLPVLVRRCIQSIIDPDSESFPLPFANALFSFLYYLASYESGRDALVSCGMVEVLLKVINWPSTETEYINFVTRAVRVIDLITNTDMQAFHAHGGLASFIQRLELEINVCEKEQSFVVNSTVTPSSAENQNAGPSSSPSTPVENQGAMEVDSLSPSSSRQIAEDKSESITVDSSSREIYTQENISKQNQSKKGLQCFPRRATLLKTMLNFLKKCIQDPVFSDSIRHLIDGTLPISLKCIISNAEYYGPSLFLLAIDVVTVYIYQEPTLLHALQDNGLTDVVNHALLEKEIPATREVLSSLPNVFSATCLNTRGLQSFVACKPFEKLFRVLISPEYLPAMRRRQCSDHIGDTAKNLGNAVDELMRHQPSLRTDAIAAIIKLLEELCAMGRDPRYVCSLPAAKTESVTAAVNGMANVTNEAGSSDEEDDDEDAPSAPVQDPLQKTANKEISGESNGIDSKTPIPLVDYILNVMRFVNVILSNNSTDDHCREFIRQKGLVPLMSILGLPNLPIDFPVTLTCQAVSSVCKSILTLAHEPQVLKQGLLHLNEALQCLEPLHKPLDPPGGSVLLEELISAPNINDATLSAQSTPLLHNMAAAHAYIITLVHMCRTGQGDIRTISVSHWGSELGLSVLKGLGSLYTSLVWESTVLLALCSNDNGLPENCSFGRQQMEKLFCKDMKSDKDDGLQKNTPEFSSNGVTSALEALSTSGSSAMDVDNPGQRACENLPISSVKGGARNSKLYHAQIKQIKALVSRLGRALAELFGLLVKLCVGSPMRQRRGQQISPLPSVPTPAARAIASALTRLLSMGLSWEPPAACPVPKFMLTFYICLVGFTSTVLFDERKYPYHLMLQKFLSCGGLDAFFNTFRWALTCGNTVNIEKGLENPQLPDGTGEFLSAWLVLLEKMINPKNVLESPHMLSQKLNQPGNLSFNPVLYLIHIHKRAFESIMYLWNKKPLFGYGEKIAKSMLAVICHLLKGETVIKEKLSKEDAQGSSSQAATNAQSQQLMEAEAVNQDHVTQLIDMGFSRSLATEALLNTNSLVQATDYLLSYTSSLARGSSSANAEGLEMEWEMSEEDQMLRAIAMSLGENVLVSINQVENEPNKTEEQKEIEFEQQQEEPLSTHVIDEFTSQIVDGCIRLVDALPDTVYRCCDVLISVAARNGEEWRNKNLIDFLLAELHTQMYYIVQRLKADEPPEDNKWDFTIKRPWLSVESGFAVRLHLFSLIFEEMQIPCATRIEQSDLMPMFIKILDITALCMNSCPSEPPTKWLPFLVLLIDQYEKAAIMSARKVPLLMAPKRQWKWFDGSSGKWNNYNSSNNKLIDDAYKIGDSTVTFTAGRWNYTVCLTTMVQINEETGKSRPIMFTISDVNEVNNKDTTGKEEKKCKEQESSLEEVAGEEMSSSETALNPEAKDVNSQPVQICAIKRLTSEHCEKLVRICVSLLKVPLEPDSLHAVMRLCLRLTRRHSNAVLFANMGGPKILLSLTEQFTFTGFASLTSLLFRHILEDPVSLRNTMEKVIRSATASGSKEMHSVFRVLGPAACRDPELFTSVASSILRLIILPPSKRDDESQNNSEPAQMLKVCPSKSQTSEMPSESEVADSLIYELLNALIAKPVEVPEEVTTSENNSDAPSASDQQPSRRNNSGLISADDDDDLVMPLTMPSVDGFNDDTESLGSREVSRLSKDSSKKKKSNSSSLKNIPIIRKSGICQLLAELVRSYSQCARLITEYSYHTGDSELVPENCSALAFILDNLLHSKTAGDKETPALARVLIAAIASCNHSVEVQTSLVLEVRLALLRALSLPESSEKHSRIQALTELISTMIESCPSVSPQNQLGGCTLRSQTLTNNIVQIFLKKGIVVDLARIPHYLDLSSPHMAATVNSALKPLETLSRIANLPSANITNKVKSRANSTRDREAAPESMEEDTSSAQCSSDVTVSFEGENQAHDIGLDSTLETYQDPASFINTENEDHENADSAVESSEPNITVSVEVRERPSSQIGESRIGSFSDSIHDDQQESSDSDRNSESGHSHSEDEAEQDERAEDTDADEEEEEDDDEDDHTSRFDVDDDYTGFRIPDRDLYRLFIQIEDLFTPSGDSPVRLGGSERVRTFRLPVLADETTNSTENPAPTVPPAPRTVTTTHPLLVRQGDAQSSMQTRVHHRQRGYRPNAGSSDWDVYTSSSNASGRLPNPTVILRRLLGHNTSQDHLHLTSNFSSHPTSTTQSRVVFANSDLRIMAADDEVFDIQDQSADLPSDNSGTFASIPSTLNRWAEESRVLDGDSIHDCVTGLKPAIIKCLEAYRDDELSERRKLQDKTGDAALTAGGDGVAPSNDQNDTQTSMEVTEPNQCEDEESPIPNLPTISMPDDSSQAAAVSMLQERTPLMGTPTSVAESNISSGSSSGSTVASQASSELQLTSATTSMNTTDVGDQTNSVKTPDVCDQTSMNTTDISDQTNSVKTADVGDQASMNTTDVGDQASMNTTDVGDQASMSTTDVGDQASMNTADVGDQASMNTADVGDQASMNAADVGDQASMNAADVGDQASMNVADAGDQASMNTADVGDQASMNAADAGDQASMNAADAGDQASMSATDAGDQASMSATDAGDQASMSATDAGDQASMNTTDAGDQTDDEEMALRARALSSVGSRVLSSTPVSGVEIPEGVDPSFLAALPDNIRQEVIAEQLRLQRLRQRSLNVSSDNTNDGSSFTEVNPEFLAALPENIQEEVLAQQRAEQQGLATQNSNPDIPVDPTSFIQTLPQGLRRQVLADMDDSLLALLPPGVASEAHALRRELEARRRQIQERFFTSDSLRPASHVTARCIIRNLPHRGQWTTTPSGTASRLSTLSNAMKLRGCFLLDHEALACLLVLLFVDEPQLNTVRLHRVLRNLCHHRPTRNWLVKSLLSILERTNQNRASNLIDESITSSPGRKSESANRSGQQSWLSISLNAALGCRTNVFQIRHTKTAHNQTKERHSVGVQSVLPNAPLVTVHPLASPVICRHVLDTLISLARSFPAYFLPEVNKDKKIKDSSGKGEQKSLRSTSYNKVEGRTLKSENSNLRMESDFWDMLVKLDSLSTTSRKGKAILRNHSGSFGSALSSDDDEPKTLAFETSPLAQLIGLLAHQAVRRSSALTDRLLRLLALISLSLPEPKCNMKGKASSDLNKQSEEDHDIESTCLSPFHEEIAKTTTGSGIADDPIMFISDEIDERRTVKDYLRLAVEVLTSKTCSEEGLEDATAFLLRISRGCLRTRRTVLYLLLEGARQLGKTVCQNIMALMFELRHNLTGHENLETDDKEPEYDGKFPMKGTIQDRFTNRAVVITAPVKIKVTGGRELQLPSMQALTSKASNQAFFLRILKVIIQLNESTQSLGQNKARDAEPAAGSNAGENLTAGSAPSEDVSTTAVPPPTTDAEPAADSNTGENLTAGSAPSEDASTTVATAAPSTTATDKAVEPQSTQQEPGSLHLSKELKLEKLWDALSDCLSALADTSDHHAVLVLQPAVEAFFLVHASEKDRKKGTRRESRENEMAHIQDTQPSSPLPSSLNQTDYSYVSDSCPSNSLSSDSIKFLKFAETHRTVLNQILRQSTSPLADGPFSVLVDHTRILDFDVRRRYFRQELERIDEGSRRDDLAIHVRREHVFEDSFRELHRKTPEEWKNRFFIVFEGEEGQDAGGLLREWYTIISREIFNPMYALFTISPGDRVTYMINSSSHCNSNHLSYFKFVGCVIAKAIYDNKLLESYFTRSFYKHILGKCVKYTDMESEDYSFYQGLVFLLEHDVKELGYELTFSVEVQEFGVTEIRDLKPNGRNIQVTEENKQEYVRLVCQEKMTGAIRKQLKAFLEGFYEIIPKRLISIFNEQELELLISGLPNIDIDDLKANTEYHKYQPNSLQIQWFWRALKSFDQADRAKFLQFVTGTSKVPLQGFSALEGMNGTQKFQIHRDDRSADRLPSAHTCFNQLDLPPYETYDKLRSMLLKAIRECSEGFGFA